MGIGGQMTESGAVREAELVTAYMGLTRFTRTGWSQCTNRFWVLDYLNHGSQRQKVGDGEAFLRPSGLAALYRPKLPYHEYQEQGGSIDEAYILFRFRNGAARQFNELVGPAGYCHFQDPSQRIAERLRRLSEALFYRQPGFVFSAWAGFLELLGDLSTARRIGPALREVGPDRDEDTPVAEVVRYIRQHIDKTIRVAHLADHLHMSDSAFARTWPRRAGETPLRTINRLKIEEAKRLILEKRLSVKQTAYRLGFSSEFQLSRVFKRIEGLSPRAYLRALSAKRS